MTDHTDPPIDKEQPVPMIELPFSMLNTKDQDTEAEWRRYCLLHDAFNEILSYERKDSTSSVFLLY